MALVKIFSIEPDKKMKIRLKDLNLNTMEITGKGIELEVRDPDDGTHTGDFIIHLSQSLGMRAKPPSMESQSIGLSSLR